MKNDVYQWRRALHVPVLIVLQVLFIILFAIFVVYDPESVAPTEQKHSHDHHDHDHQDHKSDNHTKEEGNPEPAPEEPDLTGSYSGYPMFQDVHVMIFIGFGFLMTFLKKYGLSAVSLNMLCAVVCLQWATLVIGFFHLHEGKIYMNMTESMLYSDFASAAVLISFGVVIGKTSPLQLIVMALIEIVLFTINEVIGRKYLGAVDAGDTIFVHLFGAYFGLTASRVMYKPNLIDNVNQASGRTSDMFSMIGTIFLWMFWPSFNGAAAATGPPQHRAILNTYFSLCACVLASFAFSAATNKNYKFVMEHIQNATLAGGVAIGACADLMVQPHGALIVGAIAGVISTLGFSYVTPWIQDKLKVHDTCGVHNLHGMPAVIGLVLSCIMASIATFEDYGKGLYVVYPALNPDQMDEHTGLKIPEITASQQAVNQLLASIVTMAFAIVGGAITGLIMRFIGEWQHLDSAYHKGMTVMKLALSVGKITSGAVNIENSMPMEVYFDDNLFFEVGDEGDPEALADNVVEQTVVVKDQAGKTQQYRRYSVYSGTSGGVPNNAYHGSRRASYMDTKYDNSKGAGTGSQGVQVVHNSNLPPNAWGARRASIVMPAVTKTIRE